MKTPSHIIRTAHNIALKVSPVRYQRIVAIVYDKKYIEGIGIASMKTHPFQQRNSKWAYLHAELDAINHAMRHVSSPNRRFLLSACSIYVHRIRPSGELGLAKPCKNCALVLSIYEITNVFWSV